MPRILNLEDNPIDAELIREKLWEYWPDCRIERVDTEMDFIQALRRGQNRSGTGGLFTTEF